MINTGSTLNLAPSIDDIDAAGTPSLVGYWKCDDGSGNKVKDYSGNGYDLTIRRTDFPDSEHIPTAARLAQQAESKWKEHPGYLALGWAHGAMINLSDAPLLDTTSNKVVFGCELIYNDRTDGEFDVYAADFDFGTFWGGDDGSTLYDNHFTPNQGFNLLAVALGGVTNQEFGVRVMDNVLPQVQSEPMYQTMGLGSYNAVHNLMKNNPFTMIGGYDPSTSLHRAFSIDTGEVYYSEQTVGIPASLPAQEMDGVAMFGLRAQNAYPPRWGVKNFYVWSAATLPYLKEGVQWLAAHPGKIPPWWIGK